MSPRGPLFRPGLRVRRKGEPAWEYVAFSAGCRSYTLLPLVRPDPRSVTQFEPFVDEKQPLVVSARLFRANYEEVPVNDR